MIKPTSLPKSLTCFPFGRAAWILVAVLHLVAVQPALATVWYVNNQVGQDTNNGLARRLGVEGIGPFRTIQFALKTASTADTIVVENTGMPYQESLSLAGPTNSGFPSLPFRIIGNGAVLSGTISTPARDWEHVSGDIFRFRPESGAFQQLYLKQRPVPYVDGGVDELDAAQPLSWTLIQGQIYFKADKGMLPDAYSLQHAYHQTGITLYAVSYVAIENLVVQGFYLDGINAHDNVKNSQLVGVTARGNGRSGVSVGGCSELSINSSLLGDNHWNQLRTESVATVDLVGCSVLENSLGPAIDNQGKALTESAGVTEPASAPSTPAETTPAEASPADADDPFAG